MLRLSYNRILSFLLLLSIAGCSGLPQVIVVTPTTAPTQPTSPPIPSATVTFSVKAPVNTPAGSIVAAQLIDEVTGNRTNVVLQHAGENVWTGSTPATTGEVLRYKYVRTAPSPAEEFTPTRQAVPFRLFSVMENNAAVSDVIATWSDTEFQGDQGGLRGAIRNSNTGQGVLGVIVSAGGQVTLTAYDGSYTLYNIPAGPQRVTVIAPDGSLRPAQNSSPVSASAFTVVDLSAPDPNAVQVAFSVQLPADTDPMATVRLVGNVAQLGNTFIPGLGGSAITAGRAPTLTRDANGNYTATVQLYEGTLLRYAYTLGDGRWNVELNSGGSPNLRRSMVPFVNATQADAVTAWHTGPSAPVTFEVTVPANTPPYDVVAIQFNTTEWGAPLPMWRANVNQWKYTLSYPLTFAGNWHYRFCRNLACGAADDNAPALSRAFAPQILRGNEKVTVEKWRWADDIAVPAITTLPPLARPSFHAGLSFAEPWQPNATAFHTDAIRAAQAMAANSLTLYRRGVATNFAPPVFADSLALTLPPGELKALVEQAHLAGLSNVVLHPVTCAYTPYGPCDYWPTLNPAHWNDWFNAYEQWMLTQADVAKLAGVDVLMVGDYKLQPSLPGEPGAPADADSRWRNLIAKVRQRFPGQLAFEFEIGGDSVWPNPPQFVELLDILRIHWWAPLTTNFNTPLNELTVAAGARMDERIKPVADRFPSKQIHLHLAYYSADGAATQCLKPDNKPDPCHDYRDFNPEAPDVPRYGLDLNEQADAYNAVLSAAYVRPWISGITTFGYNPVAALRDKSLSVRGKPAEAVLGQWYRRFQGK
ncbi:MAG: glycoside hydrolase family 113 [Anaerolineales bacterium]